jgi:hypothetical protein
MPWVGLARDVLVRMARYQQEVGSSKHLFVGFFVNVEERE